MLKILDIIVQQVDKNEFIVKNEDINIMQVFYDFQKIIDFLDIKIFLIEDFYFFLKKLDFLEIQKYLIIMIIY